MKRRRLPLLTMLAVIGILGSAEASVLCSNPSGSVFIRATSCKGNELQLDLANDAYTFSDRSIPLTSTETTVAEVLVAPGSYVVHAYALVHNLNGASHAPIICTIESGGGFDFGVLVLQPFLSGTNISTGTLSFSSVANLPSGGSISMTCQNNNGQPVSTAEINIVRLTAMRAASLVNQ